MRPLAGPAALLVIVVGGVLLKYCGHSEPKPDRDFMESEMTAGDKDQTGTCYSVDVVLTANFALARSAVKSWTRLDDSRWTYKVEDVQPGPAGPVHAIIAVTLARDGNRVQPVAYETSDKVTPAVEEGVKALLDAPDHYHSTKVDRCKQAAESH
jgi:hypothetical protein